MKKNKQKILCLFLSLCMIISCMVGISVTASAEPAAIGDSGLTWEFDNGTLTISGTGAIPDYESQSARPWNNVKNSITSVNIGDGVTSIGKMAFYSFANLASVTISNNVTSIGQNAFMYCKKLASVTIPSSVISIGKTAFGACENLESVTILSGVISISEAAFSGCSKLASVTIPNSVTSIDKTAFSRCTSLTSVTIPSSVTSIGQSAFFNCSNLATVTFEPRSAEAITTNPTLTIGKYAFESTKNGAAVAYGTGDAVLNDGTTEIKAGDLLTTIYSTSAKTLTWTVKSAHTHIWSYAADGATITANCGEGCDITTAPTITVTAPALAQEGGTESAEATLSKSTTWSTEIGIVDDPAISYYQTETANATTGGEALLAAPTTAGNYYAQITIENEEADDAVAAVAYTIEPAPVAVSEVTLQQSSEAVHIGDSVMLTATVLPEDGADTTVTWSVTNNAVKLYRDPDCTDEVGTDATDTLTVYAKSTSSAIATVYATSNSDEAIDAYRTVRFSYAVTLSGGDNAVMKAISDDLGNEFASSLLNTPVGIGAFLRDFSGFITLLYEADDGYVFEPFEPIEQNGVTVTWTDEATLTITGEPTADVEIELPDAVEANNKIDISEGDVTVSTADESVSVTVDDELVPPTEYHVIFFTYEEIEGGESLTRVGNEFPTEIGTYIAAVCANENSEFYTGENRSDPFIIVAPEPEPEPEPESKSRNDIAIGTYSRPVYHTISNTTMVVDPIKDSGTPATAEKHSTGEDETKAVAADKIGKLLDVTDESGNAGYAEISSTGSDLADAVLDDEDRAAMANGEDVHVYIEVEEITPTAEEQALVDAAVAQAGDNVVVAMFLDIDLFKQVGNGSAVQMHETNGKIEVSIDLPDELKNDDLDVERTYYVVRIHNGEVELIPATYDPETGKLTFYTDKFSMYVLCYVDVDLSEPVDSDDDDEVEIDGGIIGPTEKPAQEADVQGAGETNPHTGAALPDLAVLVLSAAAAAVTFRKRQK